MDLFLKNNLKTLHQLFKLEDVFAIILTFLTGLILASGGIPALSLKIIAGLIVVIFIIMGGNSINQYYDFEIDKLNKPYRPIPSGKISKKNVLRISVTLYIFAILISLIISPICLLISLIGIVISIIYSAPPFRLKERFIINNIAISFGYSFVFFSVGWLIFKRIEEIPIWIVALFFIYDIIAINSKDYTDIEGDTKYGCKTFPTVFGLKKAMIFDYIILFFMFFVMIILSLLTVIPLNFIILGIYGIIFETFAYYNSILNKKLDYPYKINFFTHFVIRIFIIISFFIFSVY